jgi:hypothetical protein
MNTTTQMIFRSAPLGAAFLLGADFNKGALLKAMSEDKKRP